MKKLHSDLLEILKWIDDVLVKNNIEYSIGCGTALGFRRDGKIIEWDDDIDLLIPEKNWYAAIQALKANQTNRFKLAVPYENGYHMSLAKVFDLTKEYDIPEKEYRDKSFENRIYIDLFRVIPTKCNIKPKSLGFWTSYYYIKNAKHNKLVNAIKTFTFFVPNKFIENKIEKKIKKIYDENGSNFVMHEMLNRKAYPNTIDSFKRVNLMGVETCVISDINKYLENHYGPNFMVPKKFNHGIKEN